MSFRPCIGPTLTRASSATSYTDFTVDGRSGAAPRAFASRAEGLWNGSSAACSKLSIPHCYSIVSAAFSLASIPLSIYPNHVRRPGLRAPGFRVHFGQARSVVIPSVHLGPELSNTHITNVYRNPPTRDRLVNPPRTPAGLFAPPSGIPARIVFRICPNRTFSCAATQSPAEPAYPAAPAAAPLRVHRVGCTAASLHSTLLHGLRLQFPGIHGMLISPFLHSPALVR
ncbi:hypothetical protein FB451DRAFT_1454296 [Mycena latifolia]|nr:hypothetical protein FB451DRAFT_1454296 [Mycena latifolia]